MKKQSNLSRLMGYAGGHRILTYLSWVLSVMSALLALVPFWYIWRIIHDILEVSPNFSQAGNVTSYGWSAVLFAVISIVVYIAALMCSHMSAFRVAANIRKELMRHITALPLGVTEKYGSGKLRRIVNSSSAATETYLAHRLPDKAGAVATPIGLLFLLLAFDWRLGDAAPCKENTPGNQKRKYAVNCRCIEHHRQTQPLCICPLCLVF